MIDCVGRMLSFSRGVVLAAAGLTVVAQGQGIVAPNAAAAPTTPDATMPAFDVVSVKLSKSDSNNIRIAYKPDGYSATNVPLKMLIQNAYGIRGDLISGTPGWADSMRFDFDAKVAGADVDALKKLSNEQRRLMLQPVLEDRFKLKVHSQTKQLPVYELVLSKGGSKLKEAAPGDTYANGIKGPDGVAHAGNMIMRPGQLTGQAVPVASLVNLLSQQLQHTVIDKTGLTGKYDLELNWTPEEGRGGLGPPPADSQQYVAPQSDESVPSIFTALQEQLGLKLQSSKGPVETLVIDHVEMPTEN